MRVFRTIHWKEPVRKVRYFTTKIQIQGYREELNNRGLKLSDLEIEELILNSRAEVVHALNEAVGYGEVIYNGAKEYMRNIDES
tara:strand:+ start:271 stop:522 length:252 start_codon:yes stop_codon:yes gene_type:complete